jgi:hypothetical protein
VQRKYSFAPLYYLPCCVKYYKRISILIDAEPIAIGSAAKYNQVKNTAGQTSAEKYYREGHPGPKQNYTCITPSEFILSPVSLFQEVKGRGKLQL